MTREQRQAVGWGILAAGLLGAAIFVGSRNLRHIDAALVGYTFACLFAAFGLGYRYAMWLLRPPTRRYWRSGWAAFLRRGRLWGRLRDLVSRFVGMFLLNLFIWRRHPVRGLTHLLLMWGCLLAAAITFPLVFGWVHFQTVPGDLSRYRVFVFGLPTVSFGHATLIGHVIFHGLEQHARGVNNCLASINIVLASGRIGRPGCGYSTITGQGNGQGGREHGQKADQLPGGRDIENAEHRRHVAAFWGVAEEELPHAGVDCYELFRKVERGEVKGLLSWSFNPVVSLPDSTFIKRMLGKLEFFACVDFFLSETARFADVVLPGSQHEEDEGTVCSTEGRVIKVNPAVTPPGDARQDWRILQDVAKALGRERGFNFAGPRAIFEELCRASQGGVADYSGITYEKIERQWGVFWPCPATGPDGAPVDHPGTPRLFEPGSWNPVAKGSGPFFFPDGKARFHAVTYEPPTEDVDADYPVILTTGRVVSMFLSGNQTRRIGPLVDQYAEPKLELHPILAGRHGIADGDWVTVESRRGRLTVRCQVVTTIRPDVVFVPYHWPGDKSVNRVTISSQDPVSKIPEYKVCAVRLRKAEEPEYARRLEPQQ